MNTFLLTLIQCGAFILIPVTSFAMGLWLIIRFIGMDNQISPLLLALVIGFSFFEASTIGMLIDPRGGFSKLPEIIRTSGWVVLGATLCVFVFVPIYRGIMKMFQ